MLDRYQQLVEEERHRDLIRRTEARAQINAARFACQEQTTPQGKRSTAHSEAQADQATRKTASLPA